LTLSVQSIVRFIYRVSNLIGQSQLVVTLGFGACVAHGALYPPRTFAPGCVMKSWCVQPAEGLSNKNRDTLKRMVADE
jgi:hypothetical protein